MQICDFRRKFATQCLLQACGIVFSIANIFGERNSLDKVFCEGDSEQGFLGRELWTGSSGQRVLDGSSGQGVVDRELWTGSSEQRVLDRELWTKSSGQGVLDKEYQILRMRRVLRTHLCSCEPKACAQRSKLFHKMVRSTLRSRAKMQKVSGQNLG